MKVWRRIKLGLGCILLFSSYLFGASVEMDYKVGLEAFKDKLYSMSIVQFQSILDKIDKKHELYDDTLYYLALSYYYVGDYNNAMKYFDKLLNEVPESEYMGKALFWKGVIYYDTGDYNQAIRTLRKYLEMFPIELYAPRAQYLLGYIYMLKNYYRQAEQELQTLLKRYEKAEEVEDGMYRLGQLYYLWGKYKDAVENLKNFIKKYPNSKYIPNAFYFLGVSYYNLEQYNDAEVSLKNAIEKNTEYIPEALYYLGITEFALNNYEAGISYLKQLVNGYIDTEVGKKEFFVDAIYKLAFALEQQNRTPEAIDFYKIILSRYKDNEEYSTKATVRLAKALKSMGEQKEAEELLRQAPQIPEILITIANIKESPEEKYEAYENIIKNYPNTPQEKQALLEAIDYAMKINDYEKVIKYGNIFLERYPSDKLYPEVMRVTALSALKSENFPLAISLYQKLYEGDFAQEYKAEGLFGLGYVNFLRKKYDIAIKFLENFTKEFKNSQKVPRALLVIGICYERLGKTDLALSYYNRVLVEYPSSDDAKGALLKKGWLYLKLSQYSFALESAEKLLQYENLDESTTKDALEIKALALFNMKDYKKAIDTYEKLVSMSTDPSTKIYYLMQISACYYNMEDYISSANVYQNRIKPIALQNNLTEKVIEANIWSCWAYIKAQSFQNYQKVYSELVENYKKEEKVAKFLLELGQYWYSVEKFDEARKVLEDLVTIFPMSGYSEEGLYWLGWSYYKLGNTRKFEETFEKYVSLYPKGKYTLEVAFNLAENAFSKGDAVKAQKYYNFIIQNYPDSKESQQSQLRLSQLKLAGKSVSDQKLTPPGSSAKETEIQDTEKELEKIATTSKDEEVKLQAKYELAMYYKSQGRYADAKKLFEEITEKTLSRIGAEAQFQIAEIYRATGDFEKASREYLKVAYIYKDYKDIVAKSLYFSALCYKNLKMYNEMNQIIEKIKKEYRDTEWYQKALELSK